MDHKFISSAELEVYFDTNDHEIILESEECGADQSILISETLQDLQSTNPHTTPLPCNPSLILCGRKVMGQTSHLGPDKNLGPLFHVCLVHKDT